MERNGPLKNKMGSALVQALFFELRGDSFPASYTTKTRDHVVDGVTYTSLKRIYLECLDPTEETFVQLAFEGDWLQWNKIKNNGVLQGFFKRSKKVNPEVPWYVEWREELETTLRSKGIKTIIEIADSKGTNALAAAKFLATGEWKGRRGRPTKNEVEQERRIQSGIEKENAGDLARMDEFTQKRLKNK